MTLADQIREFVERRYVVPARKAGNPTVTITAGDVHREMHLQSRAPAVCGALKSKILQRQCAMVLVSWDGPAQGMAVNVTYSLEGGASVGAATNIEHAPSNNSAVTADELVQVRRTLLRLLDALERRTTQAEGLVSKITRLSYAGVIPREVAALMKVVAVMRNASEHQAKQLSASESVALRSSWKAISEWAANANIHFNA